MKLIHTKLKFLSVFLMSFSSVPLWATATSDLQTELDSTTLGASSAYTLTEISDISNYTGSYITKYITSTDADGNITYTPVYYKVVIEDKSYGSATTVSYYWQEDGTLGTVDTGDLAFNLSYDGSSSATLSDGAYTGNVIGYYTEDYDNASIFNEGDISSITGDFINNYAGYRGGSIYNEGGTIDSVSGDFIGNYAGLEGSAIYNEEGDISTITGNFVANSAGVYGGSSIYSSDGTIDSITGDFIGNDGGIYSDDGTIGSIAGDFINNTASYGAAIDINASEIGTITGDFIANSAEYVGGAIYLSSVAFYRGTIDSINGDFIDNYAGYDGGAIYNAGIIDSISGDFIGNSATTGGAIYNEKSSVSGSENYDGHILSLLSNFENNSSTFGGAIYNAGAIDLITGDFTNNTAQYGGAIYNAEADTYTVDSDSFYYAGIIKTIVGDFIFNSADFGGAIYNIGVLESITGNFTSNSATTGGAIYNISEDDIYSIVGDFTENTATDNGGAVYNEGNIDSIVGNFTSNSADLGGAIYNTDDFDYITGDFTSNSATTGGAIYNTSEADIDGIDGDFSENTAADNGGAIYNTGDIDNVVANFTDNTATLGGAIYLGEDAEITISSNRYLVYLHTGNYAGSDADNASSSDDANGGFAYMLSGSDLYFDADKDSTIILGDGSTGYDSIAGEGSIIKTGEGDLIIYSSLSYADCSLYVKEGYVEYANTQDELGLSYIDIYEGAIFATSTDTLYAFDNDIYNDGIINITSGTLVDEIEGNYSIAGDIDTSISISGYLGFDFSRSDDVFLTAIADSEGSISEVTDVSIYLGNLEDKVLFDESLSLSAGDYFTTVYYYSDIELISSFENKNGDIEYTYSLSADGQLSLNPVVSIFETTLSNLYYAGESYIPSSYTLSIATSTNYSTIHKYYFDDNGSYESVYLNIDIYDYDSFSQGVKFDDSYTGEYIANTSEEDGGAIYNALGTKVESIVGAFIENTALAGGAIYNNGTIESIKSDFIYNESTLSGGGAIYNTTYATIGEIAADFIGNETDLGNGGAIYNSGDIASIEGNFYNNSAAYGGAIYTREDITLKASSGNDYYYLDNAASYGGFLYIYEGEVIFDVESDASITIGAIGSAYDSIASNEKNEDDISIIKTGEGDLIINSHLSSYYGSFSVEEGRLYLSADILDLTDGEDITFSFYVAEDATLALLSGTWNNDNDSIEIDGTLEIAGEVESTISISSDLLIRQVGVLSIDAGDLDSDSIINDGEIILNSGTLRNDNITGDGSILINGEVETTVDIDLNIVFDFRDGVVNNLSGSGSNVTINDLTIYLDTILEANTYDILSDIALSEDSDILVYYYDGTLELSQKLSDGTEVYSLSDDGEFILGASASVFNTTLTKLYYDDYIYIKSGYSLGVASTSDAYSIVKYYADGDDYNAALLSVNVADIDLTSDDASEDILSISYEWQEDIAGNLILAEVESESDFSVFYSSYDSSSERESITDSRESINTNFISINYEDSSSIEGGILYSYVSTLDDIGSFINNTVISQGDVYGGLVYAYANILDDNTLEVIDGDIVGNYAQGDSVFGGAIYNYSKGGTYSSDAIIYEIYANIIGNYSLATDGVVKGGIFYNEAYGISFIGEIFGDFLGNGACATEGVSGGVIYNSANYTESFAYITATIGGIFGDVLGNYAYTSTGDVYGGVIYNYAEQGYDGISANIVCIEGDFVSNYGQSLDGAVYGGVIYNYYGTIAAIEGNITSNYASGTSSALGGAVYNEGGTITFTAIDDLYYIGNYASTDSIIDANDDANGGFLYMKDGSVNFDIASDASITIGDGTVGYDSIAGTGAINLQGGGELIVNSSIEYFTGTFNLLDGTLVFGGDETIISSEASFNIVLTSANISTSSIISVLGNLVLTDSSSPIDITISIGDYGSVLGKSVTIHNEEYANLINLIADEIHSEYITVNGNTVEISNSIEITTTDSSGKEGTLSFSLDENDLVNLAISGADFEISQGDSQSIDIITSDSANCLVLNGGTLNTSSVSVNSDTGTDSTKLVIESGTINLTGTLSFESGINSSMNLVLSGGSVVFDSSNSILDSTLSINSSTISSNSINLLGSDLSLADTSFVQETTISISTGTSGEMSTISLDDISSLENASIAIVGSVSMLKDATYKISDTTLVDYVDTNASENGTFSIEEGSTYVVVNSLSAFQNTLTSNANEMSLAYALDNISADGESVGDAVYDAKVAFKQSVAQAGLDSLIMNNYSNIAELNSMLLSNLNFANVNRARYILAKSSVEDFEVESEEVATIKYTKFAQLQSINLLGSKDSTNGIAGYDYWSVGSLANIDAILTKNALVGVSIGGVYNKTEGDSGDNANSTAFLLNAYATIKSGIYPFELFGNIGYAHFWNKASKNIFASKWDSDAFNALGGIAFDFETGIENLSLKPIAMLNIAILNSDNASYCNGIEVEESSYLSAKLMLGLEGEYAISEKFKAIIRAMYACELADSSYDFNYSFSNGFISDIAYTGGKVGRSSALVGLGLSYDFSETCSAYFDYNAYIYNNLTTHSLNLSVGIKF